MTNLVLTKTKEIISFSKWFSGKTTVPGEQAIYNVRHPTIQCETGYQHWNGEFWGQFEMTIENAYINRKTMDPHQNLDWRLILR